MSKKVSANKAKFNGAFDMVLPSGYFQSEKKITVRLKRSENLFRWISTAEPNQLLWDSKRKKLYFLNSERGLFEMAFFKVKGGAI